MSQLRDALFEHEMFLPRGGGWHGIGRLRKIEATWDFTKDETEGELNAMCSDGLVVAQDLNVMRGDSLVREQHFAATIQGKIARERRWQELNRRHPALIAQEASTSDLVLALIVSVGEDWTALAFSESFSAQALNIYLWYRTTAEVEGAVADLIGAGLIEDAQPFSEAQGRVLAPTAEGRIHYARSVLPRLGLIADYSILRALDPEAAPPMFAGLGLSPIFTDNLQFRWEEAQRCRSANAWLASTVIYGSILEGLLLPSLEAVRARAMASPKAQRDKAGNLKQLENWSLEYLLKVAAEIGLVEPTLANFANALRDARNLVHPDKQIRERGQPDASVARLSNDVVRDVVTSLRARRT